MLEHVCGFRARKYPGGMLRHRGAIAAAGALVVGVMVLSAIDLKAMDESKARIDRNFKITLLPKQPELPANVRYCGNDGQNGTESMIPVTESSWAEAKQGFVDAHGKVVIPIVFENVHYFSEGLAAAQDSKTHKWGFIDKSGKYVIQPQYESYAKFHQGVAAVVVKNKGGRLIDKTGRVVFARGKSTIEELVPGLFVVTAANNRVGLIDKAGKLIVPMEFDSIAKINANDVQDELYSPLFVDAVAKEDDDRFFTIKKDGKEGIIDASGKILIPVNFQQIVAYTNNHAVFSENDKYGFLDSTGEVVIEPRYDFVSGFDDLIVVKENQKWSFIDSHGKAVAGPAIKGISNKVGCQWLSEGLGAVLIDKKFGFVNARGELAIKPKYDWALSFSEHCAPVLRDEHWRYIDLAGNEIGPANIGSIGRFARGHANISLRGPLYWFMNFRNIEGETENLTTHYDWLSKQGNKSDASDTGADDSYIRR